MKKSSLFVFIFSFVVVLFSIPAQQEVDWDENDRLRDKRYQLDKALDTVGIKPGMTVAEVGSGYGYVVFKLAKRVGPTGTVYAEDFSDYAMEELKARASERNLSNIETIIGSQDNPKLPEGIFDMVLFHATFNFIKNPVKLLNNLAPCLKPSGKVVLIEMEKSRAVDLDGNPVPEYFYSRQEYLDIFDKTVFKVDRIDDKVVSHNTIFVLSIK
jgi:ubiquinone/menaquinone biosynthesis C-methylase UbiE